MITEQNRTEQNRTEQNRTEQNRERWIDIAKGLGILLVILGHSGINPIIYKWIYSFHMPLFFIISGYLYRSGSKNIGFPAFAKKKAKAYLLPYITLGLINLVIILSIEYLWHKYTPDMPLKYLLGVCLTHHKQMPHCTPIWFLPAIFIALIIFDRIKQINNQKCQYLAVLLCAAVSYTLYCVDFPELIWKISPALMGVGFMQVGNELQKQTVKIKNAPWLLIAFCFSFGAVFSAINPVHIDMCNNTYGNILLMIPGAVLGSVALLALSAKLEKLPNSNFLNRIILFFGANTIIIMGFDYFARNIFEEICKIINIPFNWALCFFGKLVILPVVIVCVNWAKGIQKKLLHFPGGANIM